MVTSKLFGGINIALGIIAIIVQMCWMFIYGEYQFFFVIIHDTYAFASAGLWGGIALFVSGILTIKVDFPETKSGLMVASFFAGLCSVVILALPSATIAGLGGSTYDDGHAAILGLLIVTGSLGVMNNVALCYKLNSK